MLKDVVKQKPDLVNVRADLPGTVLRGGAW